MYLLWFNKYLGAPYLSTVGYFQKGKVFNILTTRMYILQYIILNNGILKLNLSVLPSSEGYISVFQYTP